MNHTMPHISRPALGLAVILTLMLAACEFVQVDEGRDEPIAEILTAVSSADAQGDAERALRRLLNKAEIGMSWETTDQPAPFSSYELSKPVFEDLAAQQAAFNRGEQGVPSTLGSAYALMVSSSETAARVARESVFEHPVQPITVSFDDVMTSLDWARKQALTQPETAAGAHLIALIPETNGAPLNAETVLSPVQRFLFGIWLHKYAPSMPFVVEDGATLDGLAAKFPPGGGNQNCPTGTFLLGKYEFDEARWTGESGRSNPIGTLRKSGNDVTQMCYNADVSVAALVVKGGSNSVVVPMDGTRSGCVNNTVLPTVGGGSSNYPGLSNVKFCGGFQSCIDAANAYLAVRTAAGCTSEEACMQEYLTRLNGCHNQGLVGTP